MRGAVNVHICYYDIASFFGAKKMQKSSWRHILFRGHIMCKKLYSRIFATLGVIVVAFLLYLPDTRNYLHAYLSSVISAVKSACRTTQTTTFIQSYRVKDTADTFGIVQARDSGYAITGRTLNHNELMGYSMFWLKADQRGNKTWSKLFNNGNSEGRAITQLADDTYVAAGQAVDFRTDEEQEQLEAQGDNFVVKFDDKGGTVWARTVSQQSIDEAFTLSPKAAGGFVMSGATGVLTGRPDVADVTHAVFIGNFTGDGETNWLKKIDGDEKMARSMTPTKDGGSILIGNVKLVDENGQNVPAIVKLKPNGSYEWATGLENVPLEFPMVEPDGKGGFTWKTQPSKMHLPFGTFFAARQADDGGYVALGSYNSAISTEALNNVQLHALKESSFVAVKVDSRGKLQWARVVNIKKFMEDSVIEKTKDGGYIIMGNNLVGGYISDATAKQGAAYEKMLDDYYAKYPQGTPETPASKKAMQELSDEIETWQSGLVVKNIVLIKMDANFNYQWGKILGGTKNMEGYDIMQATDSGYAIAGTWHTGITHRVLTSLMEYTEAMIIKLDANGNLGGDNGLVADFSDAETSDVTSYVVTDALGSSGLAVEYPMDNVMRSIKAGDKKGATTVASKAKTYRVKFCNVAAKGDAAGGVAVTKTRPQMKYDETKEVEATSKNGKPINEELMPVLKHVFADVKLWDDYAGISLDYRFKRLVTKDDIVQLATAVQNLGYKISSDSNGDFTATKIGRTLNFHFKLGNLNEGKLELTY